MLSYYRNVFCEVDKCKRLRLKKIGKLAVVTNLSEVLKEELKKASNIFFIAKQETPSGRNQVLARLSKSAASGNPLTGASNSRTSTLGTRGFCRVRRELSLLAEGRHIFGRRPKAREKNRKTALEKSLAPRVPY